MSHLEEIPPYPAGESYRKQFEWLWYHGPYMLMTLYLFVMLALVAKVYTLVTRAWRVVR